MQQERENTNMENESGEDKAEQRSEKDASERGKEEKDDSRQYLEDTPGE